MAQQASIRTSSSREYTSLERTGRAGAIYLKRIVRYHQIKIKRVARSQSLENTYSVPIGLRGLATAKVAQGPSRVAEHAELAAVSQQAKQRLESSAAEDIVAAMGAVTSNVTKSPDGLLSHIGLRAGKELDEDGDSASLNDDLGLGGRARGDVGQGPSSLELHQGVGGS